LLAAIISIGAAALLPWGWRPQSVTAVVAIAAIAGNAYATGAPFDYPTLAALIGCLMSLPIARELSQRRLLTAVAQREEAEVSMRLAQVGDQLTLRAGQADNLLQRSCRLVAEALQADVSHAFLIENDFLVCGAAYGETLEENEVYEQSRISRDTVAGLIERLGREGAVRLTMADAREFRAAPPQLKHGITMAIYFPLRRGAEIIGIQSAEYRSRDTALPGARLNLARGISHLVSLALESARLVRALEASDRVKTDFLASMSHELRTPLNVIIGYNDLLLEGAFDPLSSEQARTLERVQHSARELIELVTTTLELSRNDGRSDRPQQHEVHIEALVEDLMQEMRAVPRRSGVRLVWNVAKDLPLVYTDRRHLKMILKNLVDNAIKFTERGRVTVEALEADGGVALRVSDTGIGILPDDIQRIFEPFRRSDSPSVQRLGGVGLGLYIVQRLVQGLEGRIDVRSVPERGSTFTVWIPLSLSSADQRPREGLAQAG
jgi:signal transduction histidine kinase